MGNDMLVKYSVVAKLIWIPWMTIIRIIKLFCKAIVCSFKRIYVAQLEARYP